MVCMADSVSPPTTSRASSFRKFRNSSRISDQRVLAQPLKCVSLSSMKGIIAYMLTINLSALSPLLTAFLPVFVAFLAGVLRQDKFPQWANELISYVVILGLALLQVFVIGKLTGNSIADFALVAAYMTAILHTSYGQQLQQAVQTNVLS